MGAWRRLAGSAKSVGLGYCAHASVCVHDEPQPLCTFCAWTGAQDDGLTGALRLCEAWEDAKSVGVPINKSRSAFLALRQAHFLAQVGKGRELREPKA